MPTAIRAIEDRPGLGILMMLGAWFLFSLVDTNAKWLALMTVPAAQVVLGRYSVHLAIATVQLMRDGNVREQLNTSHKGSLLIRSALLASATFSNFIALNYLPLTVTSAIMFSSPILVCLLSWPLLGERVGPWRVFAIVLGFVGVLIVIRPASDSFHWTMLMILYNALALALYSLMTRKLSGIVSVNVMQVYMGAVGTFAILPIALWQWQSLDGHGWLLWVALGAFGWLGHQLLTTAHRYATASTLMPFSYSFIIYLSILSYFFFDHLPDRWTVIGAVVVIASGLIIWKRENR